MSKYLALCDLDDTLLTSEKKITEETISFLKEFVELGNKFCICTGRPYNGAIEYDKALGLKMPMVCDNGCSIYHLDGKDIFFEIDLDVFKSFMNEVKGMDKMLYIATGHKVSYFHHMEFIPSWIIHNEGNDLEFIEYDYEPKVAPLICNFWVLDDKWEEFQKVMNQYKDKMFFRYWGSREDFHSVEIHSLSASKGNALRYLQEYYGIDEDKTMAFGDQMNDESMIEAAHYGVGMINACLDLKPSCSHFTTEDFNHDGVVQFIKTNHLY